MVRLVEMSPNWLGEVRFGNVAKMLYHSLFEFPFSLTNIQNIAVGTSNAVDKVAAVASDIFATFRF